MNFKFIHAADIHLDSPLVGLSEYPDAPANRLRGASREALAELVTRAIDEQVTFMVIAGDLYDGDWKDYNTGIFLASQMGRLKKAGIRAYLLFGNHDAESEMTKKLGMPDNVVTFSSRAAHFHKIDEYKVALHGQSFKEKVTVDNLAFNYKPAVPGYFNIGVLHTGLEGYKAHPHYAPCTVNELHAKGYNYWALGHVHEFQKWDEQSTIVFPGNLQGRHVREPGRRGAVIVTVEDSKVVVERLYLDVLRWEVRKVDVSDCVGLDDVASEVGKELEHMLSIDGNVPRAVRVVLEGKSRAHGILFARGGELRAEVLASAAAIDSDRLWVEKVKVATKPFETLQGGHGSGEALAELQAIFEEAERDPEFLEQLEAELKPFLARAPGDLKEDVLLIDLAKQKQFAELVREVAPSLLARLSGGVD
jgi:exonuclease SbcD